MVKKLSKKKNLINILLAGAGVAFASLSIAAKFKKPDSVYTNEPEQKNLLEGKKVAFVSDESEPSNADGVRGHLEAIGESKINGGFYDKYVKRVFDLILSFGGLVVLAPVYAGISLAIKIDDPGPVLFTQKRIGRNKRYFKLHKFRSMKMSTPHDVPTHMLENPDQYITKVGKFLRAHSLDELPQIWDIFIGNMSVIGPRPALWNQDVLTAEREKYGVNEIKPGLTGLAQINGRDAIELEAKAKLDGEYVRTESFITDLKCFFGTISAVLSRDGVVEGGTGELAKVGRNYLQGKTPEELIGHIGFGQPVELDFGAKKKVLVTGAGSYIGESFRRYAKDHYPNLIVDAIDMLDGSWNSKSFGNYDIVYHVAGIAHADVGNVDDEVKEKYYKVNTDLAIKVCNKAKSDGVKQFIFMSSMIVYGDSAPFGTEKIIDEKTVPKAANFYGDSKLQADVALRDLADDDFKVIILRPPMIYGQGSKGNYPTLAKLAKKLPIFPDVNNSRSMLHIDNLCEFLCQIIQIKCFKENAIVLIPQNPVWTKTSNMVKEIAEVSGKRIHITKVLRPIVYVGGKLNGKIGGLVNKAFGNNCYAHELSIYDGLDYQKISLKKSVLLTEGKTSDIQIEDHKRKHLLVVSQYFYPENFRVNDICQEWIKRGYEVTVLTGIPNYPEGKFFEGYDKRTRLSERWNGINIIRLPIEARGSGSIQLARNYLSFVHQGALWVRKNNVKADLVFTYEVSPMTQALVGVWYSMRYKIPHVLYVTDLWPENVEVVTGIHNKLFIGSIQKMVDYIYNRCDYILTSSNSFINAIEKRGVSRDKLEFWPQYAESFYKPVITNNSMEIPQDGVFNFIFAGNIGYAQGLGILVKAASELKKKGYLVRFNIIGDGRYLPELKKAINRINVENYFNFIDRKPATDIPAYLSKGDALLITLSKSKVFSITIPAKTQSCLACGRPILVSADGEVQEIIKSANAGLVSDAEDVDGFVNNIIKMKNMTEEELRQFSENAISYSESYFDKNKLLDRIDEIFEEDFN